MNFFKFLFAATMASTTPKNPFKGSVEYQEGDSEKLLTFNFENVPTDAAIAAGDKIEIAFPDAATNTDLTGTTLESEWGTPTLEFSANKMTLTSGANDGAWPQQLEFNLQQTNTIPPYSSKSQFTITLTPNAGSQTTTSIDLPKELKFGGSVEYKEADDQLTFEFSDPAEAAELTKIDIVFPGELSGTAKLADNSDWTISNSKKTISLHQTPGSNSWPGELKITDAIGETRFDSESHITITFEDDAKLSGSLETLTIDVPETLVKETPSGSKGSSLSVLSLALLLVA